MVETKDNVNALSQLSNQLFDQGGDLPRQMLQAMAEKLMSFEADQACGAGYGQRSQTRVNQRNGYRHRDWDTRVGTIDLAIPKLRQGTYFPEWLLEPRRRAERGLMAVIVEAYVKGVSTRRVDGLVKTMGLEGISKSQVSALCQELDETVRSFRDRPLDNGPYTYVWLDGINIKCREGGRVVNVVAVVATGVSADGKREILGMDIFTSEDGAAWTSFLRGLVARGLKDVQLVISDAHEGLKQAIAAVLPGASWQRCRTHFMRNLLTRVPKAAQDMVATLVRSIFTQPDAHTVRTQHRRVVAQLAKDFPQASQMLEDAGPDILAFAAFPKEHWKQIWSNNPQERLNKEIRRRTDVVGIFPNREAIIRLVGALLAEQNDEWLIVRRYMSPETLAKARLKVIDGEFSTTMEEKKEVAKKKSDRAA